MEFSDHIHDLNYIIEGEVVEVRHIAGLEKHYTIPYVCVLRHQDEREFELLKSPIDENNSSKRLLLSQKEGSNNFDRFHVSQSKKKLFPGWHYNRFGTEIQFSEN